VTPDGLTPEKKAALMAGVTELLRVELNKNP
jgi:4-oxalocrotonate tautomerase